MLEWQPIETAPMDGTWILVARGKELGVARWNGTNWGLGGMCYFNRPEYWMPLPAPPPDEDVSDGSSAAKVAKALADEFRKRGQYGR